MTADLRTLLEQLNRARIIAGKQRVSFAEIARATGGSKSTVAAVVAGTYHAQTEIGRASWGVRVFIWVGGG